MTPNHYPIDGSGLLEAIEAAIPDPMGRLGNHPKLMFIHPANREPVARLLILLDLCAAMASAVYDNSVEHLSPIPAAVVDQAWRHMYQINRELTYATAPSAIRGHGGQHSPDPRPSDADASGFVRVHAIHRPPLVMTHSDLARQIAELIAQSWPDPAAAVAAERGAIADWLRSGGYSASVTPAGIPLPEFIASGRHHGAIVKAPPPPAPPQTGAIHIPMVPIYAGRFLMGSPQDEADLFNDEGPQHEVQLETFFLSRTPITQAQWREVASLPPFTSHLDLDPSHFKGDDLPVERVSWHDAMEFCARLSRHTGQAYTLPSEAQWEYACRAGTTTPFHWGETLTREQANFGGDQTMPVGTFASNAWGLKGMHGNVWEWCLDDWHESYVGAPDDGSAWVNGGKGLGKSCAAGPGSPPSGAAARLAVTGTSQASAVTSMVSESPAPDRRSLGKPCAAARGTLSPMAAARPTASGTTLASAFTSLVSASPAAPNPLKLLRGGSWYDLPGFCRSACRFRGLPGFRARFVGFRVCCLPQD